MYKEAKRKPTSKTYKKNYSPSILIVLSSLSLLPCILLLHLFAKQHTFMIFHQCLRLFLPPSLDDKIVLRQGNCLFAGITVLSDQITCVSGERVIRSRAVQYSASCPCDNYGFILLCQLIAAHLLRRICNNQKALMDPLHA